MVATLVSCYFVLHIGRFFLGSWKFSNHFPKEFKISLSFFDFEILTFDFLSQFWSIMERCKNGAILQQWQNHNDWKVFLYLKPLLVILSKLLTKSSTVVWQGADLEEVASNSKCPVEIKVNRGGMVLQNWRVQSFKHIYVQS